MVRVIFRNIHTAQYTVRQNLLLPKNYFVKATLATKVFSTKNSWFHEFFVNKVKEKISKFFTHAVWKNEKLLTCNIISSNQFRTSFYGKKLLLRIFCEEMMAIKFRNFITVYSATTAF